MRILFAGSSIHSAEVLSYLLPREEIVAVLTQAARSRVRGKQKESSVTAMAHMAGIPVLQPDRLGRDARAAVQEFRPDILICVAYGRIFGPKFLSLFPEGGINLHPSLLPRYRGPSPIHAAILAGDSRTGVSIQQIAEGMDEGAIILQEPLEIRAEEGRAGLEVRCFALGKELLVQALRLIAKKAHTLTEQDAAEASYCSLISREDGNIHWGESGELIMRKARAYEGWPGIYTSLEGRRVKLLAIQYSAHQGSAAPGSITRIDGGIHVQSGKGHIIITELQMEGKKPLSWDAFVNGYHDLEGRRFTT